jgi:hypothetical membrane protein
MKKAQSVSSVASLLVLLSYAVFALLALARYPLPYSALTNWLSDLDSVALNPGGAIFYNLGLVLTAVLLAVFFVGLASLKIANRRAKPDAIDDPGFRAPGRPGHADERSLSD